jgi:citrate lyase beta subunit
MAVRSRSFAFGSWRHLCTVESAFVKPRRSALYIPASNERAAKKAVQLHADCIILDLEDSVNPEQKEHARKLACDLVTTKAFGRREVVIRVNGTDTPWFTDDLSAVASAAPHAVLIPKISTQENVREVEGFLVRKNSLFTRIWAMMETPLSILNAASIASATPRLQCLVVGTEDLVKALHAEHVPDRSSVALALQAVVLAARAHGLGVLDGVLADIHNAPLLRAHCEQARALGFDGKTVVHPSQVRLSVARRGAPSDERFAPD